MEKYFLQCQKMKHQTRFSHSSQNTDGYRPFSGNAIEKYRLPGVDILWCNWELWPLCQLTPVAKWPLSPLQPYRPQFTINHGACALKAG